MTRLLWIKTAAISTLGALLITVQLLAQRDANATAHYDDYIDIPPVASKAAAQIDITPFPTCRSSYINLSSDENYPIPHWIYSLPKDADKALILAIAKTESRFKPYARSHRGAVGLMQLMPATADYMMDKQGRPSVQLASMTPQDSFTYTPKTPFDFADPYVSLAVGHRYIRYLQDKPYIGTNIAYTLAAYNAGPGNLIKWKKRFGTSLSEAEFARRIPFRETRHYVTKVMKDYHTYKQLLPDITDTVWLQADNC